MDRIRAPSPTSPTANPSLPPTTSLSSSPSSLSPHATPFYPSSLGRTKSQCWLESPLSDRGKMSFDRVTYRDVVIATPPPSKAIERQPRLDVTPPRIRVRSEIHKVSDAALDEEGWCIVRSRRSRRCLDTTRFRLTLREFHHMYGSVLRWMRSSKPTAP